MSRKALLMGLILLTSLSTITFAEGIEITPAIGYRMGGSFYNFNTRQEIDIKDDESASITLGFEINEDVTIEASWSLQETEFKINGSLPPMLDSAEVDIEYWHIGVMMRPAEGDRFEPFIVASAGGTHFRPQARGTSSDTRFSLSFGGGVRAMFGDHLGIRLQARMYGTFVHGSTAAICGTGGCALGFSGDGFWQLDASAGLIFAF